MGIIEIKNDPSYIMYRLKCVNIYNAKRELTLGKEYIGWLDKDSGLFYITNDYGGTNQVSIDRFDLINKTDVRTGGEYNGIR